MGLVSQNVTDLTDLTDSTDFSLFKFLVDKNYQFREKEKHKIVLESCLIQDYPGTELNPGTELK